MLCSPLGLGGQCELEKLILDGIFRRECDARTGNGLSPPPYTCTFSPSLFSEFRGVLCPTPAAAALAELRLALPLLCSVISANCQLFMGNANEKIK